MKGRDYKSLIHNSPFGFVYHESTDSGKGTPSDFRITEVNAAFEALSGCSSKMLEGRTTGELASRREGKGFDWAGYHDAVSNRRDEGEFEFYSEPSDKWFKVQLYRSEEGCFAAAFTDITDQKRNNENLKTSEKRYRGLLESQNDLIVRVDRENRFTYVNDAYCRMFGKSREELIGRTFMPFVHEDDLPQTLASMEQLKHHPWRAQMIQRAMTRDGWRWLHWEDSAVLDEHGDIREIQGVGRDITELKKAESKFKKAQTQLKSLLSEVPAVVYTIKNCDGIPKIAYVNKNVKNILGYPPEKYIEDFEFWKAQVHPADKEKLLKRFAEHAKTDLAGEEKTIEYRFRDREGRYHWLFDRYRVISGEDGTTEIVGAWLDITHQKEEQQALENEQRLRDIVENIDEAFWLWSSDMTVLLYASEKFEDVFDISPEELTNGPDAFFRVIHENDLSRIRDALNQGGNAGYFHEEYRIYDKKGNVRWIEFKRFPVTNEEGEAVRFVGLASDITSRKEAEIELQLAKEKAEESNRLKSAFLATISHELRTPLTSIIGFSQIIKSSTENPEEAKYASIINESGRQFLGMIEDIFDIALTEQGAVTIRDQSFDLETFAREKLQGLEELLNESGKGDRIAVIYDPDEKLLKTQISCDRMKVGQVLTNLFRNAVKFTESGTLTFGFRKEQDNEIRFFVSDTGIGIPEEKLDVIFDFFRQADDSTTRKYEGLGLGLAISRNITQAMGGSLSVISTPGKGSVFSLRVPVNEVSTAPNNAGGNNEPARVHKRSRIGTF